MNLTSKLPQTGTTIFAAMSARARQYQAVNLSQGFPDFEPDPRLIRILTEVSMEGFHQYAPMQGWQALRQVLSDRIAQRDRFRYDPDREITITSGATQALFSAAHAMIHPGDEVILFSPAYDCYEPGIRLAGGKPVYVPLSFPDFAINWAQLEQVINANTRGIFVNHPHNPSGATLSMEDLDRLAQICKKHELWLISDEVYEYMVYDDKPHHSVASHPELRARSVVISSFGKTLHVTGWKVGYCLAPSAMMAEIRKVHQFTTFSVPTPFQVAISRYLREEPEKVDGLSRFYQAKRDLFVNMLAETKFEPLECKGTYFQLATYDNIKDCSDQVFAQWLPQAVGVACIPISVFYPDQQDHRVVRFCFAKKDDTLRAAIARLSAL